MAEEEDQRGAVGGVRERVDRRPDVPARGENPKKILVKPPPPLELGANNKVAWESFINGFEWYAMAIELEDQPPKVQVAVFMSTIGSGVREIFNGFELSQAQQSNLKLIQERFAAYFAPSGNEIYESFKFNNLVQDEEECIDDFVTRVRTQASKCNFPAGSKSRLIRDRVIHGIRSTQMREEILKRTRLSLDETIAICKACEKAAEHSKEMAGTAGKVEVNAITKQKDVKKKHDSESPCDKCGLKHAYRNCPAYRKKCNKCDRIGHFAAMCKKSADSSGKQKSRGKIKQIEKELDSDSDSEGEKNVDALRIYAIKKGSKDQDDLWKCTMRVDHTSIVVNIDTGAQCNVITKKILSKLPKKDIEDSRVKRLITYDGGKINVIGRVKLDCVIRKKTVPLWFQVIQGDHGCVLDGKSAIKAGLIKRVNKINEDIFNGLGCLKDFVYDAKTVENPEFVIHPARVVPYKIAKEVKAEIKEMVKLGVIEPCHDATDAVSPMVVVKRNGKLRICADLTDVNKNVKRHHFPLTGIDDVAARISGSKYFTILDCKKGFWQVRLSERTSKLCTFATPWGRYSYLRLPFGLVSAPELFQQIMTSLLGGIKGVEISMDDILIHASTEDKLAELTKTVIDILFKNGMKLNKSKCEFNKTSLMFLGHRLTADGMMPDESKLQAIDLIERPKDKKALQRFLGCINYVGKFVRNLSNLTAPLRELMRKEVAWDWTVTHDRAFAALKDALKSPPVLAFYDVNKPVTLSVDSSSYAFGAVLLQDGRPIAYATKALTDTQRDWPQINKEAGAIRFACRKFHNYIWGQEITVESDHKPLEAICAKPLAQAPLRLRKILYEVKEYNVKVKYVKGTEIPLADTLSRDCRAIPSKNDEENSDELEVNLMTCLSEDAESRYKVALSRDSVLTQVIKFVQKGWPNSSNEVPKCIRHFFSFRDELDFTDGLLFKGDRIVVPSEERSNALKNIHAGHSGVQASLRRARESVYWPGMSSEVINMIEKCKVCEKNQKSNDKETVFMKRIPEVPFEIVASDLFEFKGKQYVLIVDSYSGYYDFKLLKSTTSAAVIKFMKEKFSDFGIPMEVHSDGGPQYSSREFKVFAKEWGFKHIISSPYFARSNGLAERYVQTAKNLLKRCSQDQQDVRMALLMQRNTPGAELRAPVERLMSRKTRNPLSTTMNSLAPKTVKKNTQNLKEVREKQKMYADRNAKELDQLPVGSKVRVQERDKSWTSGKVVDRVSDRSYNVELDDGRTVRRNRHFLHKTKAENLSSPIANSPGDIQLPPDATSSSEDVVDSNSNIDQQPPTPQHPTEQSTSAATSHTQLLLYRDLHTASM
ncbi:uncharacterized protein K02A2.6-like isoform X3 [Lutzomyia longipalpis]|uniref:uncharacterized protein K02A2.6-like isoform X3 n=1 Tax=Lutzomyia longipalpis TaxID=7200 RepID=UPI002483CDE2|nr:uncharacterized protein K02A2.6-like isoform X3 [Lutzomyia longipalpis]XP_055690612.1 uncharacterized protein K02A2.6-like isoform X3 [Lutzomyia longipalpis]